MVLHLTFNGKQSEIEKTYTVENRTAPSVVLRNSEGDYRQRIYDAYWTNPVKDATATNLLNARQDTLKTYNGQTFRVSEMQDVWPGIQGFEIAQRKLYYRTADGLYVSGLDGANKVTIDATPCLALAIDNNLSRLYWANETGTWYMPLIGSDNNHFVTTATQINTLKGVEKIAIDNTPQ